MIIALTYILSKLCRQNVSAFTGHYKVTAYVADD
jgi:hypothetical protein